MKRKEKYRKAQSARFLLASPCGTLASMTTQKSQNMFLHLLDIVVNIVVIVGVVVAIRTFLVSPFQVEGNSMSETLHNEEYIIIDKFSYLIGEPERGDIVVFHPPDSDGKYYVKRVIGIPGDDVIIRGGNVYVQAAGSDLQIQLDEPYLDERNAGSTFRHPPGSGDPSEERYAVPEGSYFVMGDNRQGSLDSRSFQDLNNTPSPFVSEERISGKVWLVALPITKIHALEPPEYNL